MREITSGNKPISIQIRSEKKGQKVRILGEGPTEGCEFAAKVLKRRSGPTHRTAKAAWDSIMTSRNYVVLHEYTEDSTEGGVEGRRCKVLVNIKDIAKQLDVKKQVLQKEANCGTLAQFIKGKISKENSVAEMNDGGPKILKIPTFEIPSLQNDDESPNTFVVPDEIPDKQYVWSETQAKQLNHACGQPPRWYHGLARTFNELRFGLTTFGPGKLKKFFGLRKKTWITPTGLGSYPKDVKENFNKESAGLYLMIHGLASEPACWEKHVAKISKDSKFNNIDYFTPEVYKKGNCSTDDALKPLWRLVKSYAKKYPDKPIVLMGVSNGARLSMALEEKLRSKGYKNPVMVQGLAGPFYGTNRDLILRWSPQHRKAIRKELTLGYTGLLEKMPTENLKNRQFHFRISTEDQLVQPWRSALPLIPGAKHSIKRGVGHSSIINDLGIQKDVLEFLNNPLSVSEWATQ